MVAYLILLLAALSRLLPHALGGVGLNVTAVGGGLLFFGARRPRREAIVAALVLAATDVYLTAVVFHAPFHLRDYALSWAWYAAVPLLGRAMLARSCSAVRIGGAALASATSFFLLSNLVVWAGQMYPHTYAGLLACYTAALPFYRNDAVSTLLTAGLLFGVPALADAVMARQRVGVALRSGFAEGVPRSARTPVDSRWD